MSKKKAAIIGGIILLAVAGAVYGTWYYMNHMKKDSDDRVYVQKISSIMGYPTGNQNRYSGIVEPQKTINVTVDTDRTIAELLVAEGDEIAEGTVLFTYETDDLEMDLAQAKLELENTDNEISNYKTQIAELTKERDAAAEENKFEYTTQIQTLQTNIKQSEFEKESKRLEIDKIQKKMDNSQVISTTAGVVKTINSTDGKTPSADEKNTFISILSTGGYRIRGNVNEQNIASINIGSTVVVRSRVDSEVSWRGTIASIDTESPDSTASEDSGMSDSGSSLTTSSEYPFYIELESADGLMLGQHVYIEMDEGQEEVKEGIWLYSSYLKQEEDESFYVWADNGNDLLEKRRIEVGTYDEALDEYEIKSGLTDADLIAWPMDGLYEGVATVTSEEEVDYSSDLYNQETEESIMEGETEFFDEGSDEIMDTEWIPVEEEPKLDTEVSQ